MGTGTSVRLRGSEDKVSDNDLKTALSLHIGESHVRLCGIGLQSIRGFPYFWEYLGIGRLKNRFDGVVSRQAC